MRRKGQAAMEFLMTYGWAIVVVLAAIGALAYFDVLNPGKLLPDKTIFPSPIPHTDNALIKASTNSMEIPMRNNINFPITLPLTGSVTNGGTECTAVTLSGTYKGAAINATTLIPNGGAFLLKFTCTGTAGAVGDKFKADFSFDYVNTETTQARIQSGSVEGKYQ